MTFFLCCLSTFGISAWLTGLVRKYALRKSILDIPNERSSHTIPTPRGGGIAIVVTFLLALFCLYGIRAIEFNLFMALTGGGIVIAALGYCDDVASVRTKTRFFIHLIAACWAVYWLGSIATLDLGIIKVSLHPLVVFLTLVGIVWCINFYNFMDGIDGLAGGEALFVSLAGALALYWLGFGELAGVLWLLFSAVAGFLVWNWPPAKIFLGDVGSGFLGFVFAVFALYTINKALLPLSFWMILSAIFFIDATLTVVYRACQGKRWYEAHREHAYQRLIAFGASHKQVTTGILLMNLLVLMPLAYSIFYWPGQVTLCFMSAMAGLGLIWYKIKV